MYDDYSVSGNKFVSQKGPVPFCVYTCGERSNNFIEDMMNLVILFS